MPRHRDLAVVEEVGDGVLLSDYPHPDAPSGDVVGRVAERERRSDESVQKILVRNAERCFRLGMQIGRSRSSRWQART